MADKTGDKKDFIVSMKDRGPGDFVDDPENYCIYCGCGNPGRDHKCPEFKAAMKKSAIQKFALVVQKIVIQKKKSDCPEIERVLLTNKDGSAGFGFLIRG